jgi:uncharacterized protein YcbK (DUF882 family)
MALTALDRIIRYAGYAAAALMFTAALASGLRAGETPPDMDRYFFSGDGYLNLYSEKNGTSFTGNYRKGHWMYDETALKEICRVFDAPWEPSGMGLSLRLIAFIDYLEDHLHKGALVTIVSGYRDPEYNTTLREKGSLAAKASLHQYGMAADLKIDGVAPEALWHTVRGLHFGGTGYYHGDVVHIDVGPARFWDETTSGVGTDISDGNKLIGMVTDFDVYQPNMTVTLRFIRMTAFPIHVIPEFSLIRQDRPEDVEDRLGFLPHFSIPRADGCMRFENMDDMADIRWQLPVGLAPGRYTIEARFCDEAWPDMPCRVRTPAFEIRPF